MYRIVFGAPAQGPAAPHSRLTLAAILLLWAATGSADLSGAQLPSVDDGGWEFAGVPAIGFDSDEGFQYGAIAVVDRYGEPGEYLPYFLPLQPTLLLSTEGRRDFTAFFDTPYLLPRGWRLTAFVGSEHQTATPYYGLGNDSEYDEELEREDGPNPHFYRFGRTRNQLTVDLQRSIGATPWRLLLGGGASRTSIDPTPHDEGTTFLAAQLDSSSEPSPGGWTNFVKAGLVWDTRDREVGPREGVWSEVLVKRAEETLAGDHSFTRWTVTDRRYFPLGDRLVLANRLLLQGTSGDTPFFELQQVETSFRAQEGLGGAKTLRGVPKNRYTGRGMFLWNAELRWRASEFTAFNREFHLVLSGFVDSGRVWEGGVELGDTVSDLHHGYGGGLRLGMGDNFVVALDAGHSQESTAPIYIGLGYLY